LLEHLSSVFSTSKWHECYMEEVLEQEQQKNVNASISTDEQDKKVVLFTECQKYAVENHSANMLVTQLMGEARYHGEERKNIAKAQRKVYDREISRT
jgi:lantibiotic modifying enzyme